MTGLTEQYFADKIALLFEYPQPWLTEWWGVRLWLVLIGVLFLFLPTLWSKFFGKRKTAIRHGVDAIFQDDKVLTFREISLKWASSTNDKGFSFEEVFTQLIRAFWNGKFESGERESVLSVTYPVKQNPSHEYIRIDAPISRFYVYSYVVLNDWHMVEFLFFRKNNVKRDKNSAPLYQFYEEFSRKEYSDYTSQCVEVIWNTLSIRKQDFQKWLQQSSLRLPNDW